MAARWRVHPPGRRYSASGSLQARKCHEFETDHGDIVMRQPRKPTSRKVNMSRAVRPYKCLIDLSNRCPIGKSDERASACRLAGAGPTRDAHST
jgi:hypothetical protein